MLFPAERGDGRCAGTLRSPSHDSAGSPHDESEESDVYGFDEEEEGEEEEED